MKNCIFCQIIKREIPAYIIFENNEVIVFQSMENHPLIVPKRHIQDIYDLDKETGSAIMEVAVKIAKAVKKSLKADGINLIQANEPAAHQDVFHFHMHIKPRWKNDGVILHWNETLVEEKTRESTALAIKSSINE